MIPPTTRRRRFRASTTDPALRQFSGSCCNGALQKKPDKGPVVGTKGMKSPYRVSLEQRKRELSGLVLEKGLDHQRDALRAILAVACLSDESNEPAAVGLTRLLERPPSSRFRL